jgi:trans-aconitate 2-methyltransferase
MPTWDAQQYLRFENERTRPCRDLVARIALSAPGRAIDLGCGPGNSTAVLAERWPAAELTGLDSSKPMIAAARKAQSNVNWRAGDISAWAGERGEACDLVFSNAAMQWVDGHPQIFRELFDRVAPGGALAIQMPDNLDALAQRLMREMARSARWCDHFAAGPLRDWHVLDLTAYYDELAPTAAALDMWRTEYLHIMPDAAAIVDWYKGTGLRPFLEALPDDQTRGEFIAEYLEAIRLAYPPRGDGRTIFPFRRLFFIAYQRQRT